jgi:hypothetical protein
MELIKNVLGEPKQNPIEQGFDTGMASTGNYTVVSANITRILAPLMLFDYQFRITQIIE